MTTKLDGGDVIFTGKDDITTIKLGIRVCNLHDHQALLLQDWLHVLDLISPAWITWFR